MEDQIRELANRYFEEIGSEWLLEEHKAFAFNLCIQEVEKLKSPVLASEETIRQRVEARINELQEEIKSQELKYLEAEKWREETYIQLTEDGARKGKQRKKENDRARQFAFVRYTNSVLADFLESQFLKGEAQAQAKEEQPTTKVWALYYWYLQEAEGFKGFHTARMKTCEELAQKHGLGTQNFYQTFNAIGREAHEKNPKRNPVNIEKVIPLLEDHPQAQRLAIDELKEIKKDFTG